METTDTLIPSQEVVAREVAGEFVLLNLSSGTYFGLNEVGSQVWNWITQDNVREFGALCERVVQEYGIAADVAQADISALIGQLVEHELIVRQPA